MMSSWFAITVTLLCLTINRMTLSQENKDAALNTGQGTAAKDVNANSDNKFDTNNKANLVWKRKDVLNQLKNVGRPAQIQLPNNPHLDSFLSKHVKPEITMSGDDFFLNIDRRFAFKPGIRLAPFRSFAEPWPLPQQYSSRPETVFRINPATFQIQILNRTSDILQAAVKRYTEIVLKRSLEEPYHFINNFDKNFEKFNVDDPDKYKSVVPLRNLCVYVAGSDIGYPRLNYNETYSLVLNRNEARLDAQEVWGALRGLETFSQLVYRRRPDQQLYVRETVIQDFPRFPHRGLLIDTARHYIHKNVLMQMMDVMAYNKMNVLHWHIVDDNSFPYASEVYPNLSLKGAGHPTSIYTLKDVRELVEFARLRGIRIIPEFDSPGHTLSWLGYPEIKSTCYSGNEALSGPLGPIDPVKNETYEFMRNLFKEIYSVFPDQFVHLGGDELHSECWATNPSIVKFLQENAQIPPPSAGYRSNLRDYVDRAVGYYFKRLISNLKEASAVRSNGASFIMWEDVLKNTKEVPKDSILQVWFKSQMTIRELNNKGYKALFSSCWYLDHTKYGTDWTKYYKCEPSPYSKTEEDAGKLLGGEACMWAEYITSDSLMTTTWPRASAVAERLWSSRSVTDMNSATKRFQEHRCRMAFRGVPVGHSMGPDSCAIGPVKPYNVSSNEQEAPKILMNIGRHEVDLTMITQQSPSIRLLDPGCGYKVTCLMTNSADPDQLASSESEPSVLNGKMDANYANLVSYDGHAVDNYLKRQLQMYARKLQESNMKMYLPAINLLLTCIGIYLMILASRVWRNRQRNLHSPKHSPKLTT